MKPGDIVKYIGPTTALRGAEAVVVAVNDLKLTPGKPIALCFKDAHDGLHTCDGLTPKGHGYWATPDVIATLEEYALYEQRTKQQLAAQEASSAIVSEYLAK